MNEKSRRELSRTEVFKLITLMQSPDKGVVAMKLNDIKYCEFAVNELGLEGLKPTHIQSLRTEFKIPQQMFGVNPPKEHKSISLQLVETVEKRVSQLEGSLLSHSLRLDDCIREIAGLKKEVAEIAKHFRLNRMNEHDHSKRPGASQ